MPKELHKKLAKQARKQGLSGERAAAYIYGTLHKVEEKRSTSTRRRTGKR